MSHHKRGRAKNARAGCLLCKPHKANGEKGTEGAQTMQERKARGAERSDAYATEPEDPSDYFDASTLGEAVALALLEMSDD